MISLAVAVVLMAAAPSSAQVLVYPPTVNVAVTYFDYHSDGSCPDFNSGTNPGIVLPGMVQANLDAAGLPVANPNVTLYSWGIGKWFRPWSQQKLEAYGNDFQRPAYANGGRTVAAVNTATFDTSYKNVVIQDNLAFTLIDNVNGVYQFQSGAFFPLDGRGFGADVPTINYNGLPLDRNPGDAAYNPHNYSFAMHLKKGFQYRTGLTFQYEGDDDMWVYINGQLVLDIGGIHNTTPGQFVLDNLAAGLGLAVGDSATLDVFYCERQAEGSDIKITTNLIANAPTTLILTMVPKVDTLAAGSIAVFTGTVDDQFKNPMPALNQYIAWSLKPTGTRSYISPVSGPIDTFYAIQAFVSDTITVSFNEPGQKPLSPVSDVVYVKAGPPDHLVIEADPNGRTRSPLRDDPVGGNGSITLGSTDTTKSVFATLRDKYGNYAGQSQNTKWDTITIITPNVVTVRSGVAANGEGIIKKTGVQDSELIVATALTAAGQPMLNIAGHTMMDTVKAYVSQITYDSLRIVYLVPGDTTMIKSLVMTTDQDTMLTVQGLRTDFKTWVSVPGNWSLSSTLKSDTAAPAGRVNWLFSPSDTGHGTITVTFGGKTASIPVTVNPGAPRSLVLYPKAGVPSATNKALPRDSTDVAGVSFPLVAKLFDHNGVWLGSYESATSNNLISWQFLNISDTSIGKLSTLSGYTTSFLSTKAHDSVTVIATFKQGTVVYTDTIGVTIVPGPVSRLVIEANSDPNYSPNAAKPVDSITINSNETYKYVYAVLRDAYGNWVSYSQQTAWVSFDATVAQATNGIQLEGQGMVTRVAKVGITQVSATNTQTQYASLHLADTIKVIISNIYYRALRIVVNDSTNITNLTMNTNQDTTLKVLGLRSDTALWEPVVTHWGMTQGLATTPMPPSQSQQWSFSPDAPGTGWVRVYMDNDSTKPDTVFVTFTPGPPTKTDITIITPPEQLIAGDTIRALVRIQNLDGLVPGTWCYDGATGAVYQDGLGNGGGKRPSPVVIGDSGAVTLNQAPSTANKTDECFQNGIDTTKFVLYYAPYKSDTSHQIFVNLGGLAANTAPFTLLPGALDSLALEDVNGVHQPDTITLHYPNGSRTVVAVGYDRFGNKIGPENSTWTTSNSLHPVQGGTGVSRIFYETSGVTKSENGWLMATAAGGIKDSMYVLIAGPGATLVSAVTKDVNGNGLLDEIVLTYDRKVTLPADPAFLSSIYIVDPLHGNTVFAVDSIGGGLGRTDSVFTLYLKEVTGGKPQTAWTPHITVAGATGANDFVNFPTKDGAGPVIWTVTKTISNPENRKQDVVVVTFSEPITGPGGTPFSWATVKPSDVFTVYKLLPDGTYDTIPMALDSIMSFAELVNDSTLKFTMANGVDITANDYMNIKAITGQVYDSKGNAPVSDNRKAPVKVVGALPPRIVAVPNPSGPTFVHQSPGVLNFENNPNARDWVRLEHAGTVITFQITPPTSGETVDGTIIIYDAVGNRVTSAGPTNALASLKYDPSNLSSAYAYDIYWNGSNEQGLKVAPGVYRAIVYLSYNSPAKSEKKKLWGTVGISY